ncbi:MAG: hypothetical protein RhofKO_12760 [Rhodothermales bacterium]
MKALLLVLFCGLLSPLSSFAQADTEPDAPVELKQFVYVLQVISRLQTVENWTEADNAIVQEHFQRLAGLTEAGTVLLAGRTLGMSDDDFGLVILQAPDEATATTLMNEDPAVRDGIMTAKLFPYRIALMKAPETGGTP